MEVLLGDKLASGKKAASIDDLLNISASNDPAATPASNNSQQGDMDENIDIEKDDSDLTSIHPSIMSHVSSNQSLGKRKASQSADMPSFKKKNSGLALALSQISEQIAATQIEIGQVMGVIEEATIKFMDEYNEMEFEDQALVIDIFQNEGAAKIFLALHKRRRETCDKWVEQQIQKKKGG